MYKNIITLNIDNNMLKLKSWSMSSYYNNTQKLVFYRNYFIHQNYPFVCVFYTNNLY